RPGTLDGPVRIAPPRRARRLLRRPRGPSAIHRGARCRRHPRRTPGCPRLPLARGSPRPGQTQRGGTRAAGRGRRRGARTPRRERGPRPDHRHGHRPARAGPRHRPDHPRWRRGGPGRRRRGVAREIRTRPRAIHRRRRRLLARRIPARRVPRAAAPGAAGLGRRPRRHGGLPRRHRTPPRPRPHRRRGHPHATRSIPPAPHRRRKAMSHPIIQPATVRLDADLGATKEDVIRSLAGAVVDAGRADDLETMVADLLAREAKAATGMKGGIAIPHCKSEAVSTPSLGFARLDPAADFGAKDGPADLVFLISAPAGGGKEHLKVLATLARNLVRDEFVEALRGASTAEEAVGIIEGVLAPKEELASSSGSSGGAAAGAGDAAASEKPRLVAVTSCPTGIAHTYMAADALSQEAAERGVDLQVETQGSAGATALDPGVIAAADAVIFATDVGVRDRGRFAGKPVVEYGVKKGIDAPGQLISEALEAAADPDARRVAGSS